MKASSAVFWIVMIIFVVVYLVEDSQMKVLSKKRCYHNKTWYEDGDIFNHWFEGSPCKFECTCVIKSLYGNWVPSGECVHRCPKFSYPPYGCSPVSDGCCATSYICPEGEKCKDLQTGMLYKIGQTWDRNETCECTCYGEGIGKYQCKCFAKAELEESRMKALDHACELDDSQSCKACPIGMVVCPIRAKCEKWNHEYLGMFLECTCYGKLGTRCITRNKPKEQKHDERDGPDKRATQDIANANPAGIEERSRRSLSGKLSELYFSEGWTKNVEPSLMIISLK